MELRVRFPVDDVILSTLHGVAFGSPVTLLPWSERLNRHALTWVGAFSNDELIGFVQVCWDGGSHAFVLDTAVHPDHGRQGIGQQLVTAAAEEARAAGCEWLHVDYEPHLVDFYVKACGFRPTDAALLRLRD
ncbi:acetyltransferase (GNAT) family protein [Kribbella amoyensis]|uniref:Acetyltransferase (GNAT) family protein n=1 Tax=Kribbella amoyensis TaxID=996641 RepID=A0A561BNH4_9ACTN|nr:GNAT family N-acetyltransferase [Kribbella amoyensis]TWD80440.1 acetyltransferase (GNAT) family protein [Kribbella amoyensis]